MFLYVWVCTCVPVPLLMRALLLYIRSTCNIAGYLMAHACARAHALHNTYIILVLMYMAPKWEGLARLNGQ